jgi:hypothetical protein
MKPWAAVDEELVAKIKSMVMEALGAARTLEMALEVTCQALQWSDRLVEALEAADPLPRAVACQPGCTYCCHNQVEVTPPEVFSIAQMVTLYLPAAKQEGLKERALVTAALKVGKSQAELAATRKTQPCPLLAEDKCLVYPWRPFVCRAMHALSREHCRASFSAGDLTADEYYLHRYVFPLSVSAGLTQGFQAMSCQTPVLELSRALGQALLEPRLGERWLAGERVFEEV